jgi:hypothetical protein
VPHTEADIIARHHLGRQPLPAAWREASSADRLSEWLTWQRSIAHPNWNLLDRSSVGIVSPAVWPYAAKAYFRAHIERGHSPSEAINALPLPRVWIANNIVVLPTIDENSAVDVQHRTGEVLDLLAAEDATTGLAVIETNTPDNESAAENENQHSGFCRIVAETTDEVEIIAELSRPGVLVLADLYTPDWQATIETAGVIADAEVLRANRVMRGVALPAGEHRVTLTYRPLSFTMGATVSGLAWLALVVLVVVSVARPEPQRRPCCDE